MTFDGKGGCVVVAWKRLKKALEAKTFDKRVDRPEAFSIPTTQGFFNI